jgi:hypothetical protein
MSGIIAPGPPNPHCPERALEWWLRNALDEDRTLIVIFAGALSELARNVTREFF